MSIREINSGLRDVLDLVLGESQVQMGKSVRMSPKKRYLKVSELDISPYKSGMFRVKHAGLVVGLLIQGKKGWKASAVSGGSDWFKGAGGKDKALEALIKLSPNGVVMKDGQHSGRYA